MPSGCVTDTPDGHPATGRSPGLGDEADLQRVRAAGERRGGARQHRTLDPFPRRWFTRHGAGAVHGELLVQNPRCAHRHRAQGAAALLSSPAPRRRTTGMPLRDGRPHQRPHAYGNGIILGKVPCNNGLGGTAPRVTRSGSDGHVFGVAIEHFLGIGDPEKTRPPARPLRARQRSIRTGRLFHEGVRQAGPLPAPSRRSAARSVAIQRTGAGYGAAPAHQGRGRHCLPRQLQLEPSGAVFGGGPPSCRAAGAGCWSRTSPAGSSRTRSPIQGPNGPSRSGTLQLSVSNSAPAWWTSP